MRAAGNLLFRRYLPLASCLSNIQTRRYPPCSMLLLVVHPTHPPSNKSEPIPAGIILKSEWHFGAGWMSRYIRRIGCFEII